MKKIGLLCTILAVLIFSGCNRQSKSAEETQDTAQETAAAVPDSIYVLFGNGFNDPQFVEEAQKTFSAEFGVNSGIRALVFPADFGGGRTGRISLLPDLIQDEAKGLIMLGAPDGTHKSLTEMAENERDLVICSLFPQDDILGQSAGSDFVIEMAASDTENSEETEQTAADMQTLINLLPPLVSYIKTGQKPAQAGDELHKQVEKIFAPLWTVRFYSDPQSGIRASNAFVIEQKK